MSYRQQNLTPTRLSLCLIFSMVLNVIIGLEKEQEEVHYYIGKKRHESDQ